MRPLCFVLMPSGAKHDPGGGPDIDFDAIYERGIQPAVEAADMEPLRADQERTGGIIHKAMFERLLLCDFALADVTTGNPNVLYELGVRHTARPLTTLVLYAAHQKLPFDLSCVRALSYTLSEGSGFDEPAAVQFRNTLTRRLGELRAEARGPAAPDSPLFQLLSEYKGPEIARLKTDIFHEQVQYSVHTKKALAFARSRQDLAAVEAVETGLGDVAAVEAGVLIDLLLSYRALSEWGHMARLYERFPVTLQRSILAREQYAFALNRRGDWEAARDVLEQVLVDQGPSSETCGLMGRVYKDRWTKARAAGNEAQAHGFLDKAIASYAAGFEADWRDAYPGVNAVTLLDIKGDPESLKRRDELLPVVRFAVTQRLRSAKPDYWDHATLLELAVLAGDETDASTALSHALAALRAPWEGASTAGNLELIRHARSARGIDEEWLARIIANLRSPNGSSAALCDESTAASACGVQRGSRGVPNGASESMPRPAKRHASRGDP